MTDAFERVRRALADRYVVQRELGHGGMAMVYLAQDPKNARQVAIKVLRPELTAALGAERFAREIATAAPLTHPHILPIYDSGETDGVLYYVMPYIEGESLRDRLEREGPLPLEDALQIAHEVGEALGYAHSRGIVHRDIKPDNILLSEGHALVADFGIARAIEQAGGERLTESGIAVGTPMYMSPEQASGSATLDGRSDLYSLGCVLYEMLSGEPPHTGPSAQAVIAKKLAAPAPQISVVRDMVPPAVDVALMRALARTPADRFPTAVAFSEALRAKDVPAPRPRPRRRWVMAAMAVVGLAAVALGMWQLRPSPAEAKLLDHDLIAATPFRVTTSAPALRDFAVQVPAMFWTKVTGQYGPRATDAASVEQAWSAAGGTPDGGLPEAAERRIARDQGAGLLIRGVVGGNGDSVTITASLERTADGKILVPPRTVVGPADHKYRLLDSLVVLLLAREFGAAANEIPRLSRHPPEAVQAFLAGQRVGRQGPASFDSAGGLLDQALAADSTFVEAALWKYVYGELDARAGRFVWDRLEQLSPRDRAFFRAEAGLRFGAFHTSAALLDAWDSVVTGWPEFGWFEYGQALTYPGSATGTPRWRERAVAALRNAVRRNPSLAYAWAFLWELAFLDRDTAGIRADLDSFLVRTDTSRSSAPQRWRVALWLGDSAAAVRAFRPTDDLDVLNRVVWAHYVMYALEDGRGVMDADRAAQGYVSGTFPRSPVAMPYVTREFVLSAWARARGRHAESREWLMEWPPNRHPSVRDSLRRAMVLVRDVLFFGEPEDSVATDAIRFLQRVAGRPDTARADVGRCWTTLWRIGHGDTLQARVVAQRLEADGAVICAGVLDVLVSKAAHANLREPLQRLETLIRPFPFPQPGGVGKRLANLLLARMLPEIGDTAGALAAARRRQYTHSIQAMNLDDAWLLVSFLREEGRLAAMLGDTASARRAYTHYLALRENPDWEPWREERDQVQHELAALVGERPRRGARP